MRSRTGIVFGATTRRRAGQSISESILLMPLFMLMVFGLLQMAQLGIALVISNYAASAAARQMVQDNSDDAQGYLPQFHSLMSAGMKKGVLQATAETGFMRNLTVHACAQLDAFPFIGQLMGRALSQGLHGGGPDNCQNLGLVAFNASSPPSFTVHGRAIARMNYQPH